MSIWSTLFGATKPDPWRDLGDKLIPLDAEDLAEGGVAEGYARLRPALLAAGVEPIEIVEENDPDAPSYAVSAGGRRFQIYAPEPKAEPKTETKTEPASTAETSPVADDAWARAALALFTIVNAQLEGRDVTLYAINGGHDLFGAVLTDEEAQALSDAAPRPVDKPYRMRDEPPWYGQPH